MDGAYHDLFRALPEAGTLEMQSTVPENFDWSILSPKNKCTILVEALNGLDWDKDLKRLDKIEWLIRRGASYSQVWSTKLSLDEVETQQARCKAASRL
eukprot:Skav229921  [mRNA]  locus=scaffold3709:28622:28915:+ [translate_table: standard]